MSEFEKDPVSGADDVEDFDEADELDIDLLEGVRDPGGNGKVAT